MMEYCSDDFSQLRVKKGMVADLDRLSWRSPRSITWWIAHGYAATRERHAW